MKFAISRTAFPQWDLATLASEAAEHGYDGVEWAGLDGISGGVPFACLASDVAMSGRREADRRAAEELRRYVDAAQAVGCPFVKMLDTTMRGERTASAVEMGHWLIPLGDHAARRGVTILVENCLTFRRSRDLWLVMEAANHPAIAAAWDIDSAAAVDEPAAVSVPTLNSRIQYAQFAWQPDGDNAAVTKLLTRLLGIGYSGWVALRSAPTAQAPDTFLREVLTYFQAPPRVAVGPQAHSPRPRTK